MTWPDQEETIFILDDYEGELSSQFIEDYNEIFAPPTRDKLNAKYYGVYGSHTRNDNLLNETANFRFWEIKLRDRLEYVDCAGHIFHDIDGIEPVHAPAPRDSESPEKFNARKAAFMEEEYSAIYIINLLLPQELALRHDEETTTAKSSYDRMVAQYKRGRAKEIHEVTKQFLDIRLRNEDTGKYCMDFRMAYGKLEDVTRIFCDVNNANFEEFMLPEGTAKLLFVQRTMHVDWLKFWRDSIKIEKEELWELVKSLHMAHYLPASKVQKCTRCKRHNHKIKDCLKFHPK